VPTGNEQQLLLARKFFLEDLNKLGYPTEVAQLVEYDQFGVVEEVDLNYSAAQDPHKLKLKMLETKVAEQEKYKIFCERHKKKLHTYLRGYCTDALYIQLSKPDRAEFEKIAKDLNSEALWKLIVSFMTIGGEVNQSMARNSIRSKYMIARQRPGQPLEEFYKIFMSIITTTNTLKVDIGGNQDIAECFLSKLDMSRYGEMYVNYQNDVKNNIRKPVRGVQEAYEMVQNTLTLRTGSRLGMAFYGMAEETETNLKSKRKGKSPAPKVGGGAKNAGGKGDKEKGKKERESGLSY